MKTVTRYYLLLVRMTIFKKSVRRGYGGKGTLLYCWECKLVHQLWKTVWKLLRKLKINSPYDPAITPLGIYPDKTIIQKDTCIPMFITALFTIVKIQKQPTCPSTCEWTKTVWYIYTMEYYSAIRRSEVMPFAATSRQPEMIILSEVKLERERQIPYDITYMWNLKYGTNEPIYKTEINSQT